MKKTRFYLIPIPYFGDDLTVKKKISCFALDCVLEFASVDLHTTKDKFIIEHNNYGKPYIKNYPEWQFNISHTCDMLAIAISDKPVGIDIEKIRPPYWGVAKRFFTKSENEYIYHSNKEQNFRFFEIWTKKEAYIKCIGKGMSIPLNFFDTMNIENSNIKMSTFQINNYIISICEIDL